MTRGSSAASAEASYSKKARHAKDGSKAKRFESKNMVQLGKANRVLTDDVINYITRRARVGHLSDQATRRLGAAFLALNYDMITRANIFTRARTGKTIHYQIKLVDTKNALAHMGIPGPLVLRRGRRAHSDQFVAPDQRPEKPKKQKAEKKDGEEDEDDGDSNEAAAAAAAPSPKKSPKTKKGKKKSKK